MPPAADDRYQLSEQDNEQIFRDKIVPELLSDAPSQERPLAVFLIGQQGAGKTRIEYQVAEQLRSRGGFITIDSDLYKPYHPQYAQLLAEDDRLMAARTGPDGTRWMAKVQDHVRRHRLDAVVHETVQNPPYLVAAMRAYREVGYRVETAVMGVPRALSQQGILQRYHEQVRDRGHGRLTVPEKADASYHGILEGAQAIDEHKLADLAAVFRRGDGVARYLNDLDEDGEWRRAPALRQAIETERGRLTSHEDGQFRRTQDRLRAEMGPEWQADLEAVEQLAAALDGPQAPAQPQRSPFPVARLETLLRKITGRAPIAAGEDLDETRERGRPDPGIGREL